MVPHGLIKRAVFYISGFDPRGDKFYKRIFKNELSKFSKNNHIKAVFSQTNNSEYKIKSNNTNCDLFFKLDRCNSKNIPKI